MSCGSTTCTSNLSAVSASKPSSGLGWSVPNPFSLLVKINRMHGRWRQRQALLDLDEHLLADVGLSRNQALEEARKPFWT